MSVPGNLAGESETQLFLDTKTGERIQSVVVWAGAEPGQVNVVLTHNLPDPKIEAAVAAFGD